MPKRIAIFASGSGSNAETIAKYFENNPDVEVVEIVCNKEGAGVLERAERLDIPTYMINKANFKESDEALNHLQGLNLDLIVLAGFLWKVPDAMIKAFEGKIVNIHPALLPKYGGKGMYGHHVHEAVIANGEKQSGITIHFVDEVYDNGEIILQVACGVLSDDTPDTLAQRIHGLEHTYFPEVIAGVLDEQEQTA